MRVAYHSFATNPERLLGDCRALLENLLEVKRDVLSVGPPQIDVPGVPKEMNDAMKKKFLLAIQEEVWTLESALTQIEALVVRHLREDLLEPCFKMRAFEAYVGRGERLRQRIRGEFID